MIYTEDDGPGRTVLTRYGQDIGRIERSVNGDEIRTSTSGPRFDAAELREMADILDRRNQAKP